MADWKDAAKILEALVNLESLKASKKIDGPTYKRADDVFRHQLKEALKDAEQGMATV